MFTSTSLSCLLAVLLSGLLAGLFYGYCCSVNPGLTVLNDKAYLQGMQSINKVILNPVFFASFAGAMLLTGIAAVLTYRAGQLHASYYLSAAFVVYLIGVFCVTAFGNVPLNNALAAFHIDSATGEQLLKQRQLFECPWNRYHLIRTIAAVLSFLLTIIALLK